MARRSEHSTDEIRELAISNAYDLIEEKGEAGFKAREIARKMGYTVGTIYYLFGNMEQLRYHVCGRILDTWDKIVEEELKSRRDTLNYQVSRFIRFSREHRNHWEFIFAPRVNPGGEEDIPDWYLKKIEKGFRSFASPFFRKLKNKRTALNAARTMLASLYGICVLSQTGKLRLIQDDNPEALAKRLVKTYLNGLSHGK